jgi:hypothetical protein
MGRPARRMDKLTGRGAMHSPGAPSLRSEFVRLFWKQIATGVTINIAAEAVGVSSAVGMAPGAKVWGARNCTPP